MKHAYLVQSTLVILILMIPTARRGLLQGVSAENTLQTTSTDYASGFQFFYQYWEANNCLSPSLTEQQLIQRNCTVYDAYTYHTGVTVELPPSIDQAQAGLVKAKLRGATTFTGPNSSVSDIVSDVLWQVGQVPTPVQPDGLEATITLSDGGPDSWVPDTYVSILTDNGLETRNTGYLIGELMKSVTFEDLDGVGVKQLLVATTGKPWKAFVESFCVKAGYKVTRDRPATFCITPRLLTSCAALDKLRMNADPGVEFRPRKMQAFAWGAKNINYMALAYADLLLGLNGAIRALPGNASDALQLNIASSVCEQLFIGNHAPYFERDFWWQKCEGWSTDIASTSFPKYRRTVWPSIKFIPASGASFCQLFPSDSVFEDLPSFSSVDRSEATSNTGAPPDTEVAGIS